MKYERRWKLGDDLGSYDNILDPIDFDEIIMTVRANCRNKDLYDVRKTFKEILEIRLEDAHFLLENNLYEIIERCKNEESN